MRRKFFILLPRVSDALNGVVAFTRQASAFNPFTLHRKGSRTKAVAALCIVCLFWGTTWVASKEGVRYMPPLQLAGIRQTMGGLVYIVFFLSRGAALPKQKEWGSIAILALLNFALSNGLSTWGVKYISAGLGSIIGSIFPLWLVIIGFFGSQSRMKSGTIAGLFLGFTGICVIFYDHLADFLNPDFRFGIFLSLVSTWSWAFGTLYTKQHALSFNPYFALGLQMILSGPSLYVVAAFTHQTVAFSQIPWQAWATIFYLVIFGSVVAFAAYLYALQILPTEQASLYAYVNPVVAFAAGALLFGERITVAISTGVLITLGGVYLVNRSANKMLVKEEEDI